MHEMGIANSVLEAVKAEMARHPGTYPCKVGIRVGEMAAIDPDSLRFCFEAMTLETDFESVELSIEVCPRLHRCEACKCEFIVHDYETRCPQCAGVETQCIGGEELELAYLEVEQNGARPAAKKSTQ